MGGATFGRIKDWAAEILTNTDLNDEIDNILENLNPLGMDDYSENVAQMKLQTDPGELGTESLAETLAEELERIRFALAELKGVDFWYESSPYSLATLGSSIGGGVPANRIIAGSHRAESSQGNFLVPAGNARTVHLECTSDDFIYAVEDTEYIVNDDPTLTNLNAAPSTDNTCLVNDLGMNTTDDTKHIGEFGTELIVDAMGTNMSNKVGQVCAFKVVHGGNTEYFIGKVSSATKLVECRRGYFYDSTLAVVPRVAIADNDTITLMALTWIFIDIDGDLIPIYTNPRVGPVEPISPATGDYWFDTLNEKWRVFNATVWADSDATLVGVCIQDATNTVAARSFDAFRGISELNTIDLQLQDSTEVRSLLRNDRTSVFGNTINFDPDYVRWDIDTDLDAGLTEAADVLYFLYLNENGKPIISTICPYERPDLGGMYHPHQTWRCYGQVYNNSASNFEAVISYKDTTQANFAISHKVSANVLTLKVHAPPQAKQRFRNLTAATGNDQMGSILPNTQLIIASGSTLGTTDAVAANLIPHLVLNSGRAELGISSVKFRSDSLATTVAEAGNGDIAYELYTFAARTSAPVKAIGILASTQATAGVWATGLSSAAIWRTETPYENLIKITTSMSYVSRPGIIQTGVRGLGGGGGGGIGGTGSDGNNMGGSGAGGGGAAILSRRTVVRHNPGATLTLVVGTGGTSGADGVASSISGLLAPVTTLTFPGASKGGNGINGGAAGVAGGVGATTVASTAIDSLQTLCGPGGAGGANPKLNVTNNPGVQAAAYTLLDGGSIAAGGAGGTATSDDENGSGGGGGANSLLGTGGAGGNGGVNVATNPTAGGAATGNGAGGGGGGGGQEAGNIAGGAGGTGSAGLIYLDWIA